MESVYLLLGMAVFWAIVMLLLALLLFWFILPLIKMAYDSIITDEIMYYFGRKFNTETLILAFSYTENNKTKRLIAKYRLRNIKKTKKI